MRALSMNDHTNKKKDARERHREHRTKAFRVALELIAVFGIPAVIALFAGQRLDAVYSDGKTITIVLLAAAFISSWIITIVRVRSLSNDFDDTEGEIEEKKEEIHEHRSKLKEEE